MGLVLAFSFQEDRQRVISGEESLNDNQIYMQQGAKTILPCF
jgi:hypothetical protein